MPGWGMLYQSNQRIRDWAWALDKTGFKYLSMGFAIGITGWICDDRRAKELREAVSIIPLERILVETDAPYLTPRNVPELGRTNVPQNIKYVVRDLAKYMKIPEEEYRKDFPDWRLMIVAVVFQTAAVF